MPASVPPHSAVVKGTQVSIILKADQSTGRQVRGEVRDILTRGNHHRGVKVRLSDGRVGRVQAIMSNHQNTGYQAQGNQGFANQGYTHQQSSTHEPGYGQASGRYAQAASMPPQYGTQPPPPMPQRPSTSRTLEDFVPASERGEQVEYLENYENSRAQTQEEKDREALQKQFPKVDGSLIAAIYSDCAGDLSGCREMLQALSED